MKKAKFGNRTGGVKTIKCKNCSRNVENVDETTVAVTCWRCVCKGLNPNSVILSDMTAEQIGEFFNKIENNGRSKN